MVVLWGLKWPSMVFLTGIKTPMERKISLFLDDWKKSEIRTPLILRGARQVGKSYAVLDWGAKNFESVLEVNFELNPNLIQAFSSRNPQTICSILEVLTGQKIEDGQTLLFLDEIQQCPEALISMRAFKEKRNRLHVIAAGSLLEFTLQREQSFSFPVGRVSFAYLNPMSFIEFLQAVDEQNMIAYFKTLTLENPPSLAVHKRALELIRIYWRVGGMPESVLAYANSKKLLNSNTILRRLAQAYVADFSKYNASYNIGKLREILDALPRLVGRKFKYTHISKDTRARDLKQPLLDLASAGILRQIFATHANGVPLAAEHNSENFKLLALDIGLTLHMLGIGGLELFSEDSFFANEGSLAEQFVGQELLCLAPFDQAPILHYWTREKKGSEAELDYVLEWNSKVVPIEVKSGATGRLRSLKQFMIEKNSKIGVRISQAPLAMADGIISVPFYLVSELGRLILE